MATTHFKLDNNPFQFKNLQSLFERLNTNKLRMRSRNKICGITVGLALACGLTATIQGQEIFVVNSGNPTAFPQNAAIGEYGLDGSTINASLIPLLGNLWGLAISGNDLFIANGDNVSEFTTSGASAGGITDLGSANGIAISGNDVFVSNLAGAGSISEYGLDGSTISGSLVSGRTYQPHGIAVSGNDLFVASYGNGFNEPGNAVIGEYTTSGATVNASLITGLAAPWGIAISGSDLFVVNGDTIGEYGLDGSVINASLITGLSDPNSIAIFGDDLFVSNAGNGTIGEYTLSGATVNASLISGLNNPAGIVITPEPSTVALVGLGAAALFLRRRSARTSLPNPIRAE